MIHRTSGSHACPTRLAVALSLVLSLPAVAAVAAPVQARDYAWTQTATRAVDISRASLTGSVADTAPMPIVVALKLRNEKLLDDYIVEQQRPGSVAYHQWLTSEESTENFAPTADQAQAVADYLTGMGYANVEIAANRLLVTADGTAGTARRAFNTDFARVASKNGDDVANVRDAQVPAFLGGIVQGVYGLQTLNRMHTYSRDPQPLGAAKGRHGGASVTATTNYYFPHQFQTVYHAGNTPNGRSTAVAIIGWGSMTKSVSDLAHYESDYGITAVPTSVVTVGRTSRDNSGEGEWALDAQAIVGISGGVKSLTFYASYSATDANLLNTINRAVSDDTAKVVDMSWGGCETSASFADAQFKIGVTQGQTFSASSGDNGAYACGSIPNGNGSYGTQRGVSDPANSPYVIAVGGTTLTTDASQNYVGEVAWPYGGGGVSGYEAKPAWQSALSGSYRQLPDVAFDADWDNSPIAYYLSASGTRSAGYYLNGGTSLASPLFVGAWARLESAHGNGIGFAPKALYAYSSSYPFHDVTQGQNGPTATYYSAKAGYDNTTGWGSFDIQAANTFITNTPGFVSASN
ncbi:S53 family peptidase [Dokdonella sp.]|uniref:S53 family peptidase n=1 Tax=Dokdonella sp. TaxID=2291710 RepID=UPI001B198347|nr:S53 family peptidase [Dokdonella sp.]MBO9662056.1 S8/S53 family peptidase [Dokdonella sp.]